MSQSTDLTLQLVHTAVAIADAAVIADIETEGAPHSDELGTEWRDIRSMLSQHEHWQALAYAIARGLVLQHPFHAHLVRIVRRVSTGTSSRPH